ncbi:carboxypeptidase-like regulatory domain-containing protein [Empedobacter falsenii]|uniref:Carboxypeptidase-like regulatory domain-containing protein n=1 Tax=Empedobacter falsenii TaxID=343874 RepID=A0A3R8UPV2_9FLAO|nr:carboxypeptidase-like regulatory domain-containing protein [Empedobacter falsenii]RRT91831.1 carboxypeptidase-like regulatory domain-containing protein [Empedobacter falsenii]RRT92071.1 carboxypeptidase-like regulatory domain-containing protein [Empedobacter falsenii]
MNFKQIIILGFLLISSNLFAQNMIKGKVIDEKSLPIINAEIYVDNSTIKSKTNEKGEFELNLPNGQYNLIVRASLFENYILNVNTNQTNFYKVILEPEVVALQETIVQAISKEDWLYYYQTFLRLFLGNNEAAKKCKIENSKDLRFKYDKNTQQLSATSRNPLIITNNYLGYKIEYDLVDFNINFKSNYVLTLGTALFTELKSSASKEKKWQENRRKSYLGSVTHFMKAVYDNKIEEEGYDVKRLIRKDNPEYIKFKEETLLGGRIEGKVPPKIITYLVNQKVPSDSLKIVDNNDQYLNFKGLYSVEYKNEKEDLDYAKQNGAKYISNQLSIFAIKSDLLKIEENGTYYHPANLVVEGYWSWEKIANMVPMDYKNE